TEKLSGLEHLLESAKMKLAKPVTPIGLNGLLARVAGTELATWLSMAILRTQSQATYTPKNLGHFGLGLRCYTHFTSPIRRYADLVVHRALLGYLEKNPTPQGNLASIAEHISTTERRAMLAERDTVDRYAAEFLKDRVGATFGAVISGVTAAGVFVTLDDVGASGLVPIRFLGRDYFHFEPKRHRLIGRRSGIEYALGQRVSVVLLETQGVTGKLTFGLEGVSATETREPFRHRGGGGKGKERKKETTRKKKR
ncbi:MAG: RNB domain-containing ribonuclease, partial [Alphaproteobacteria bacterium]|nr:RNB domain-containing ribonuclease [Alphaproteobacteria bacterium]